MSAFQTLAAPRKDAKDSILAISQRYAADPCTQKVNLSVGAYRSEEGQPRVLDVVREAERRVVDDPQNNKEYLDHGGDASFCALSAALALGPGSAALADGRAATIQGISGTGSLRMAAEFLARFYPRSKVVMVSAPTWGNHLNILARCGLEVRQYRYYQADTRALDIQGLLEDLGGAPEGATVLLQACGHNPTGVDPSLEQWKEILKGYVSNMEADGACIRLSAEAGMEILVAQSYSKTMGLYGERVGALTIVTADPAATRGAEEMLHEIIWSSYISPPRHGAAIAATVLSDSQLRQQWQTELRGMADSIMRRRRQLYNALLAVAAPGSWVHIVNQRGMFTFTGLTQAQCELLTVKWHIYLPKDGRISLGGLPVVRCRYVAEAIKDAIESCPAH